MRRHWADPTGPLSSSHPVAKSPSPPDPIESELLRLLDGPDEEFWPGVARMCQQNPELTKPIQREAERMQADAQGKRAGGSTLARAEANDADADLRAGDRVGPFAVLDVIGHGGMGSVYLAEQKEPVRRRVALKVIKLGMDTKAVLARFEAERQALAMMDHSHIAKVLEAGVTPKGKPYFAMEYVKGVPITRYCDDAKLSLEDRLALFKQVCSGVQHAHTKGVIHRDLTPNNVLVTLQDGKPAAKIIDFGLARATDHKLTEKTLFTEQGVILGTPEYMSPEQAGLNALDIDMRSDVYTLGVLLYELLTGKLPFDAQELRAQGYDRMCRTIREAEPPRPSTKVTTNVGGTDAAAKLRRTDASTLLKRLRGDLDWIVLKCLEKDRTRRYETVGHLADDVERYLDNEPVLARAPSAAYRLAKFAKRYRGQLVATAAVFIALVGGLGVAVYYWSEAEKQATEARKQAGIAGTARAGEAAKAKEAAENAAAGQRNAEEATRNASEAERNATMFAEKVHEFDQLAGVVHLERLQAALEELAVPWKDVTAAQRWLADADRVLALRPELEKTVDGLRSRALPATPEETERDRATHPRRAELDKLTDQLGKLEQAQAMQSGGSLVLPSLTVEEEAMSAGELNALAWPLVDPKNHEGKQTDASRAVALAKHAWTKSEASGAKDCNFADTLGWAWFWNGKDDEAVWQSEAALALAPEEHKEAFTKHLSDLRARLDAGEGKAAIRTSAEFVAREVARLRGRDLLMARDHAGPVLALVGDLHACSE